MKFLKLKPLTFQINMLHEKQKSEEGTIISTFQETKKRDNKKISVKDYWEQDG